ncbi:hypothetical protein SDC9_150296 [bioreactor metagenome]|uniref:Uncharacterized protein n=1 Tax=bioreactor metagenome TaxID=1076179 RepID=A0A645ERB8_9ZZZZ
MVFKREGDLRVDDARPVGELGEALMLVRVVGVRDGKGIAAAAVEGFVEVHDLRALASVVGFAGGDFALLQELLDFPVHRYLECIFDRERAVVDKEHVVVAFGDGDFTERFDEFSHFLRIDVRVGNLVDGCAEYLLFEFGIVEFRVIHPEGGRREECVEVQPLGP